MSYQEEPLFKTKDGIMLPGFESQQLIHLRRELLSSYGLSSAQICEAASYSMAMVVRAALGLTAQDGVVCAVIADCLAGWTALGTVRHLVNSGASAHLLLLPEKAEASSDLRLQLKPLVRMGVNIVHWTSGPKNLAALNALLDTCHNVICGAHNFDKAPDESIWHLTQALNEHHIPIHSIEAPPGIDVDTGQCGLFPLFASSTLSLGAPLAGLHKGSDYVGRHYLCDTSITSALYNEAGFDLSPLFSEQPVIQIFPVKPEEPQEKPAGE